MSAYTCFLHIWRSNKTAVMAKVETSYVTRRAASKTYQQSLSKLVENLIPHPNATILCLQMILLVSHQVQFGDQRFQVLKPLRGRGKVLGCKGLNLANWMNFWKSSKRPLNQRLLREQIICLYPDICVFSALDKRHLSDIFTICQKRQFEVRNNYIVHF